MSQALLPIALHVLGLVFGIAMGPRDRPNLCAAFGLLVGFSLWVSGYFLALVVGVSPLLAQVGTYALLLVGLLTVALSRRRFGLNLIAPCFVWTVGVAGVAVALATFNITHLSPDSFRFLLGGKVVGTHGLVSFSWQVLAERGLFQPLVHSTADLFDLDYLYSYHLTLTTSFLSAFIYLGIVGLRRLAVPMPTAVALTCLAAGAMATTAIVLWHASYIHGNLSSGIYLWAFGSLFWYAQLERREDVLPLAAVALAGLGFQRLETGVVVALFLALGLSENRLGTRCVLRWNVGAVALVSAWLALVASLASSKFVSPSKSAAIITLMVVPLATWRSGKLSGMFRRLPQLALAGAVLALLLAVVTRPEHMLRAAEATATNVFEIERFMWGITPVVLLALGAILAASPRVPFDRIFSYGSLIYVLFVMTIVRLRGPYRVGWGDSGNRMLLHVVPLVFFYVALRAGPLLERKDRPPGAPPTGDIAQF